MQNNTFNIVNLHITLTSSRWESKTVNLPRQKFALRMDCCLKWTGESAQTERVERVIFYAISLYLVYTLLGYISIVI